MTVATTDMCPDYSLGCACGFCQNRKRASHDDLCTGPRVSDADPDADEIDADWAICDCGDYRENCQCVP